MKSMVQMLNRGGHFSCTHEYIFIGGVVLDINLFGGIMQNVVSDKQFKAQQKKYSKLLKKIEDFRQPVVKGLADRCSFMGSMLENLENHIKENGVVDEYTNGANQSGRKRSVEVDTYINLVKCYAVLVRQVTSSVPVLQEEDDEELSEFE